MMDWRSSSRIPGGPVALRAHGTHHGCLGCYLPQCHTHWGAWHTTPATAARAAKLAAAGAVADDLAGDEGVAGGQAVEGTISRNHLKSGHLRETSLIFL
jgi:hypothetical protein